MNPYMEDKSIPSEAIPRNLMELAEKSGNLYESMVIISKRANQLTQEIREELQGKLEEFAPSNDSLEEIHENRELIEISTYYEKLPKTTIVATEEFLNNDTYFRNPANEPGGAGTEYDYRKT